MAWNGHERPLGRKRTTLIPSPPDFTPPLPTASNVQGYLAHKKPPPPRTLQQDHAYGSMGVLGGWAFSYGRGTPHAL